MTLLIPYHTIGDAKLLQNSEVDLLIIQANNDNQQKCLRKGMIPLN